MAYFSTANICALALLKKTSPDDEPFVDAFVGLSGVYDIEKHYQWESLRGLHIISPMSAAAIGSKLSEIGSMTERRRFFSLSSPTLIVSNDRRNYFVPLWILLHCVDDTTVPFTSSLEFAKSLLSNEQTVKTYFPPVCYIVLTRTEFNSSSFTVIVLYYTEKISTTF